MDSRESRAGMENRCTDTLFGKCKARAARVWKWGNEVREDMKQCVVICYHAGYCLAGYPAEIYTLPQESSMKGEKKCIVSAPPILLFPTG